MKTVNRFIALSKRILYKKIYIIMLLLLVILTGIYKLLPEKSQSADIKVAMFCDDTSGKYENLSENLTDLNSIYSFYTTNSLEQLVNDVKSGYAHCGYYIPDNFFHDYVQGEAWDNPIKLYITPSSTFYSTINETVFSSMISVCAEDLLIYSVNNPSWNQELSTGLEYYRNSQDVFTIADTTTGEFTFENMVYHINLPILEIISIILLFSGLLGLLVFLHDKEKKIYVALSSRELIKIRLLTITTSILPVTVVGLLSLYISYGMGIYLLFGVIFAAVSLVISMILGLFIRKSTLLEKVLPLIMLTTLIVVFIKTII